MAALRASLDGEAFAACWEAGQALTMDEAVDLAHSLIGAVISGPPAVDRLGAGDTFGLTAREREVVRLLAERGIDFGRLASVTRQPEADPFDLLCHLAFGAPVRTRRERAARVRMEERKFFARYSAEARQILDELLDRYAEVGPSEFTLPHALQVPPVSTHGNVVEIAAKFGGAERLREALYELQNLLYAA